MNYSKEQLEKKANDWFLGIPQNGDLLYRLTREEIIKTIVGFALSFEQKEAQPPTSQENECDTCEYQGKFMDCCDNCTDKNNNYEQKTEKRERNSCEGCVYHDFTIHHCIVNLDCVNYSAWQPKSGGK